MERCLVFLGVGLRATLMLAATPEEAAILGAASSCRDCRMDLVYYIECRPYLLGQFFKASALVGLTFNCVLSGRLTKIQAECKLPKTECGQTVGL